jgi:hypothetical protein
MAGRGWFLKEYEFLSESPYMSFWHGERVIEAEGELKGRPFAGTGIGWDVLSPYMIERTNLISTKNGIWLIAGIFSNAFLDNNDSLKVFNPWNHPEQDPNMAINMKAIIGKVNDKYLAVFPRDLSSEYDYSLVSLDDSPFIDSSKSLRVTFTNNDEPGHSYAIAGVKKITGDLYAVKKLYNNSLDIYRFSDTTFHYVKTVLKEEFSPEGRFFPEQWEVRNGKLYQVYRRNLERFEFRISDTTFVNRKVLLDSLYDNIYDLNSNFGVDRNFKYAAKIFHYNLMKRPQDTLKIYDIDKEDFINGICLDKLRDYCFKPVVDSPYVYIHQIKVQYTGVNDNKGAVVKNYSLSAYPNPFNATVKITYSLPEDSNAELTIYDLLGRKIESLVNGFVKKGSHEAVFNAKNLSSGIYLYTLRARSYMKTNKLMLMK